MFSGDDGLNRIYFLIFTYLAAGIPFGVIISLLVRKQDVRNQGSGNTGATNVARLMGKKWGVVVLFFDALKGFAVVKIGRALGDDNYANVIAVVAVFAHCYPIYLKFKGGKGVATALGVIAALSPFYLSLCLFVFALIVAIFRRISPASLGAALSLPFFAIYFEGEIHPYGAFALAIIIWWKHKENVKRLLRGQEPKFF